MFLLMKMSCTKKINCQVKFNHITLNVTLKDLMIMSFVIVLS